MNLKKKTISILFLLTLAALFFHYNILSGDISKDPTLTPDEQKILAPMHAISSHTLFDYVKELCSDKYEGRLTGTPAYDASAQWVASLLQKWGVKPAGDNGSYFQNFPNPYSLVLDEGNITLFIPSKNNSIIEKSYRYETDYFPGCTSDSGTVKAEVVYVGYGITAPELNFDEYKGIDVKGKIVLLEPEVPVSPFKEPDVFKKWRPYSFHDYKVKNAKDHGAAAVLFDYHIVNPNCIFIKDLLILNVGTPIVNDLFSGSGKSHDKTLESLRKNKIPQSFNMGKILSIRNSTQRYPEGIGKNVIGYIEGCDPDLKKEVVMIGGHLDHLGMAPHLMPGANDNASAVAVMLGVAEAIHHSKLLPKRSIIFNFFGSEEQGVKGSEFYLDHPFIPNKNIIALINMDAVGRGTKLDATAGKNYPGLWKFFDDANRKYTHLDVTPNEFPNLARPRLDAARFMWAGIPTISFNSNGGDPLPFTYYHNSHDNPTIITPEILEDTAQLIFATVMTMVRY